MQVDLTVLLYVLGPVLTALLGINAYFVRGLVVKIEQTAQLANSCASEIAHLKEDAAETKDVLTKIAAHAGQIDSDVTVLKFAILKQIKKMEESARA